MLDETIRLARLTDHTRYHGLFFLFEVNGFLHLFNHALPYVLSETYCALIY